MTTETPATIITFNDKHITVPETWNDLPHEQLLHCFAAVIGAQLFPLKLAEVLPYQRLEILRILMGLTKQDIEYWYQARLDEHGEDGDVIFYGEMDEMLQEIRFPFEEVDTDTDRTLYRLRLDLTRCPYPAINHTRHKDKKKYYYAPADKLANLTIYELGYAFTAYERYAESQTDDALCTLLAIIYRPSKPNTKENRKKAFEGDIREPLLKYEKMVPRRAKKIKQMPVLIKQLLLFWFASCHEHIVAENEDVFSAPDDNAQPDPFGWGGLLMSLAGELVKVDEVAQQPYVNAFMYLRRLNMLQEKK